MVHVSAYVLQVVVFTAGADTFLTVDHAAVRGHLAPGVHRPQEDGFKLKKERSPVGKQVQLSIVFQFNARTLMLLF